MLMLGLVGWFTWLDKTDRLKRLLHLLQPPVSLPAPTGEAAEAGPTTSTQRGGWSRNLGHGINFSVFVGFFLRDIMMAHTFGLGASLDNFFIALLIPMFIVSGVMYAAWHSLNSGILGSKERLSLRTANMLVPSVSFWTTISLLVICLILYLIGPYLLPLLYGKDHTPDLGQLTELLDLALPILLFSGVVILGNSVLNAHGNAVVTNTAQLVVRSWQFWHCCCLASSYGVKAVMFLVW